MLTLGPLPLNLYTALLAVAVLASVGWMWHEQPRARTLAVALGIAACAALAGRAAYVALNWDYFREHASEIVALNGLSEHAALAGGSIGYWLFAIDHRHMVRPKSPFPTLSALQFSILNSQFLLGIAASIGCISNGCAYGREVFWQTDGASSLAWLLREDWPDAYGISNPRWATQVLMALWLAVALLLLMWLRRRDVAPRWLVPLSVMVFTLGDFLIQFLRGDSGPIWAGLRAYQWFDVALLLTSGFWLASARGQSPKSFDT